MSIKDHSQERTDLAETMLRPRPSHLGAGRPSHQRPAADYQYTNVSETDISTLFRSGRTIFQRGNSSQYRGLGYFTHGTTELTDSEGQVSALFTTR